MVALEACNWRELALGAKSDAKSTEVMPKEKRPTKWKQKWERSSTMSRTPQSPPVALPQLSLEQLPNAGRHTGFVPTTAQSK